MNIKAKGDTHIDLHHTTEDSGIAIGECLKKASNKFKGIRRYAHALIPMDEALTRVVIDVSNRPYLIWNVKLKVEKLGEMDTELFKEWFQAFSQSAGITLHVENIYGDNSHHIIESCFKGLARSLRAAMEIDPRNKKAIPSTKIFIFEILFSIITFCPSITVQSFSICLTLIICPFLIAILAFFPITLSFLVK